MSDEGQPHEWDAAEKDLMGEIDATIPVSARIWNYWMGGKDYYPADEEADRQFLALHPGIARAGRLFISRAVPYLVRDAGVRQFLDIGTGLPTEDNTHQVALRIAADSRIVYVDNDLLRTRARPRTADRHAPRDDRLYRRRPQQPGRDRAHRAGQAGLQPVGRRHAHGHPRPHRQPEDNDDEFARTVVGQVKEALPTHSHLAIYESANTVPANNEAIRIYNQSGAASYHLRSVRQITRFFDSFQIVAPGIVSIQQWRPDELSAALPQDIHAWGGIAQNHHMRVACTLVAGNLAHRSCASLPCRAVPCCVVQRVPERSSRRDQGTVPVGRRGSWAHPVAFRQSCSS